VKTACLALLAGLLAASAACAEPLDYGHVSDRSVCHDTRINIDERIAACKKSIALGSTTAEAQAVMLDGLGIAYAFKGDWDPALAAYAQAIKTDPSAWYAYLNRATAYRVTGKPDLAIADCTAALAIKPDAWQVYAVRATVYGAQKQTDLEIADLDRAIAIQPGAQIYRIRGEADLVKGDRDRAIVDFTASLKIEPENILTLTKRAESYMRLKNVDLAHADYRTILNIAKYRTIDPMTRAFAERELGLSDAALADFTAQIADTDKTASLEPNESESWNNACWIRAQANQDLDKATEDCNKAIALDPRNAGAVDSLGFVLYRQGRFADAIARYNAALAIDPRMPSSLYMRGVLETQTGNAQAGAADIEAAKAMDPSVEDTFAAYGVTTTK
jgi:tetratricopeptide (TPR) repeat protein